MGDLLESKLRGWTTSEFTGCACVGCLSRFLTQVSCPANNWHFAAPYRGAGKALARVNTRCIDPWQQRGMRPDTAQPEGFGACAAPAARPQRVKTASLDPLRPSDVHPRMHPNEMPVIGGTGH